jgi:hypothetical protein
MMKTTVIRRVTMLELNVWKIVHVVRIVPMVVLTVTLTLERRSVMMEALHPKNNVGIFGEVRLMHAKLTVLPC